MGAIQFSLFKGELWPVTILKDFGLFFTKKGWAKILSENYHKHAIDTAIVVVATALLLVLASPFIDLQIFTMPKVMFTFLCGFYGWSVNWVRESWKQKNGGKEPDANGKLVNKIPFSYGDVRFGTYAALLTGYLLSHLITLL